MSSVGGGLLTERVGRRVVLSLAASLLALGLVMIATVGSWELFLLAAGKVRARFRQSMSKPGLLEPDKVYEYQIDLWQTGITVKPGSRLQVEVASAAHPGTG